MPLVHAGTCSSEARESIQRLTAPSTVLSGLYLYCNCWEDAHVAADNGEIPENYFWHAIAHRQEPDPGNSAYWFRKTGKHPVFKRLQEEAAALGYAPKPDWDPFAFIQFCMSGFSSEIAMQIQLIEWQLLFDHCAGDHCAGERTS